MRRINSLIRKRIKRRSEKEYLENLEEELVYCLNLILEPTGIELSQLFSEENEDENIQFIKENGNSLN